MAHQHPSEVSLKADHIVDVVFFTAFGVGCLSIAWYFAFDPATHKGVGVGLSIFFAGLGAYLVIACLSSPYRRRISLKPATRVVTVEYSYIQLRALRAVEAVAVTAVEWVVVNRDSESEVHYARVSLRDGTELSISVAPEKAENFAVALGLPLEEVDLHNPMVDSHGPAPSIWSARRLLNAPAS